MFQLPPFPGWESIHPVIIHFPIVLLLLSPVLVLISTLLPESRGRQYMIIGLALLLVGTASLFAAAESGEAAAELADRTPEINAALQAHESLAFQSRIIFSALSLLLGAIFVLPRLKAVSFTRSQSVMASMVFLVLYSTGGIALVNTAHQGGRLVHEFGVHVVMPTQGGGHTHSAGQAGD